MGMQPLFPHNLFSFHLWHIHTFTAWGAPYFMLQIKPLNTLRYWFSYNICTVSSHSYFSWSHHRDVKTPAHSQQSKMKAPGPTLFSLFSELKVQVKLQVFHALCRLYCPVWWDRLVECLFECELWCFNELKGLLILNLITWLPPSRLLAFTLIMIYGSSTLCFLINHICHWHYPVLYSSLSLLSKELTVNYNVHSWWTDMRQRLFPMYTCLNHSQCFPSWSNTKLHSFVISLFSLCQPAVKTKSACNHISIQSD